MAAKVTVRLIVYSIPLLLVGLYLTGCTKEKRPNKVYIEVRPKNKAFETYFKKHYSGKKIIKCDTCHGGFKIIEHSKETVNAYYLVKDTADAMPTDVLIRLQLRNDTSIEISARKKPAAGQPFRPQWNAGRYVVSNSKDVAEQYDSWMAWVVLLSYR